MKPGFSAITSSKYYHQAFNSAIFDGPIRIYFVQFHETYALKIYFAIQERFENSLPHFKEVAKQIDQNIVIMIYPTEESFFRAFSLNASNSSSSSNCSNSMTLAVARGEKESVVGLLAPVIDVNVGQLMDELSDIFKQWEKAGLAEVITSASKREGPLTEHL